jgi:hypothetical protein
MTGDRKIVGIWPAGQAEEPLEAPVAAAAPEPAPVETAPPAAPPMEEWYDLTEAEVVPEDAAVGDRSLRWATFAIIALALVWAGAEAWRIIAGGFQWASISSWPPLLASLAPPLLVAGLAWMIGRRLSARTTRQQVVLLERLHAEHRALDERLDAMQQHWRVADSELQQRAEQMAHYGLDTVARLAEAGTRIEATMQSCATAASTLAERGELAQRQLDSLAIAIPKVEEVTARLSDNLRQAGQSAYQFGGQLEARIASIGVEAATAGAALSEGCDTLSERTAALNAATNDARATLISGIEHLEAAAQQQRDRALVLLAEYAASANETTNQSAADISEARSQLHSQLQQDVDALKTQAEQLQSASVSMHAALDAAAERSTEVSATLQTDVEGARERLAAVDGEFATRFATLQQALGLLSEGVGSFRTQAAASDEQTVALIQRAETLLIALDSATREIDETVPTALERLSAHAATAAASVAALTPLTEAEGARIGDIEGRIAAIGRAIEQRQQALAALDEQGDMAAATRQAELTQVESTLAALQARMTMLAEGDATALTEKLSAIEAEATASVERTEAAIDRLVEAASTRAATDLTAAIDRAAGEGVNERLTAMSAHADQAVAAAAAASDRLMRQLITIADSSAALEQRAQQVSALSSSVERETLARQMTLLGEALQSTAVDLTRILDMDVADQAWEAYLKGDRSIFARRAARLLSAAEAKDILRRYESDDSFKGQVNRYIHDFETMLRGVMDTRDGHALSVTLLSSDIGKLYVSLAQAIERLRR